MLPLFNLKKEGNNPNAPSYNTIQLCILVDVTVCPSMKSPSKIVTYCSYRAPCSIKNGRSVS